MKKLIDFDGLFDEKLNEYMHMNAGKYTEKQWENVIPKLYKQFGDTYVAKAGNTPKGYYADMTDDELVEVTPKSIRLRKRILDTATRLKAQAKLKK